MSVHSPTWKDQPRAGQPTLSWLVRGRTSVRGQVFNEHQGELPAIIPMPSASFGDSHFTYLDISKELESVVYVQESIHEPSARLL